jgi:hypothetical protein
MRGDQKTCRLARSLVKAARFLGAFEIHHKQSSSDIDTGLKELSKLTDDSKIDEPHQVICGASGSRHLRQKLYLFLPQAL